MNGKIGCSLKEIMNFIDNSDNISEQEKIEAKIHAFYKFIKWTDEDYIQYNLLLAEFKEKNKMKTKDSDEVIKTKEKGDALEKIVNFIIDKSFFLKVHPNKRSATNEIDQFVVLSDKGKQAMHEYNFSDELLGFTDKYFIGECKNYDKTVSSTWVGKFYTLLKTCGNCGLGIIFSYHGLTGKENNWYDAHGLTKVIYRMEDRKKNYILDFNIKDFELLNDKRHNFFEIIKAKKESLASNSNSTGLLNDLHEGINEMRKIYDEQVSDL